MTQRNKKLIFRKKTSRIASVDPGGPQSVAAYRTITQNLPVEPAAEQTFTIWEWDGETADQFDSSSPVLFSRSTTAPTYNGMTISAVDKSSIEGSVQNWPFYPSRSGSLLRISGSINQGGVIFPISDIATDLPDRIIVEWEALSGSSNGTSVSLMGMFYDIFTGSVHGVAGCADVGASPSNRFIFVTNNIRRVSTEIGDGVYDIRSYTYTPSYSSFELQGYKTGMTGGASRQHAIFCRSIHKTWGSLGAGGGTAYANFQSNAYSSGSFTKFGIGIFCDTSLERSIDVYLSKLRIIKHWRDGYV